MWSRTSIHGTPGRSARRLATLRLGFAWAALGAGVLLGALLVASGMPAIGLAALGAGWLVRRRLRIRAAQAGAGAEAEVAVAATLRRVRAAAIVYNLRLPDLRTDVDAVVIGPMAAVVEIKRASGRVRFYADGTVRVGRVSLPGRSLAQVIAQAAAVRRRLSGVPQVDAVLCVSGMRQRPRLVDANGIEVWVTSERHLLRVLRRLPNRIAVANARDAAAELHLMT